MVKHKLTVEQNKSRIWILGWYYMESVIHQTQLDFDVQCLEFSFSTEYLLVVE